MATATSMPEFFTNTISVLITNSDMGLGTIMGSLMFNTLGVAGLAALAIAKVIFLLHFISEFIHVPYSSYQLS